MGAVELSTTKRTWEWDLLPWAVKLYTTIFTDGICSPPFAEDFLVEHFLSDTSCFCKRHGFLESQLFGKLGPLWTKPYRRHQGRNDILGSWVFVLEVNQSRLSIGPCKQAGVPTMWHVTWEQWKKGPWLVRLHRGWIPTQLYRDYNKPLQGSLLNNQDSMGK